VTRLMPCKEAGRIKIMKRMLYVLLVFALAVSPVFAGQSKLHKKAEAAALVLYGESASSQVSAKALCTVEAYEKVSDGYSLLTEGHCVDPDESGAPDDVKYFVAPLGATSEKDGDAVEVVKWQNDGDMDAAELHVKTSKHYEVLQLAYQNPQVEEKVFYVGYPKMFNRVILEGQIASEVGTVDVPECEGVCKGRIVVQIGGGPGASGSAIISEKSGQIVGLLEGHMYENGVMMVPAKAIRSFLEKPEVKHERKIQQEEEPK